MKHEQPVDGLLLADKQADLTSHDVVAIARRQLNFRKIGHTGTLDPAATGLLVLCLGGATRLQSYLMGMDKTYEGTIRFGWATDTYDAAGNATGETVDRSIDEVDLEPAIDRFRGVIQQVPPAFSAKKIQGVRAYELARKGEAPALEARQVEVFEFRLTKVEGAMAHFRIRCSAGTYVRSIAHELGAAIGIPAHLASLRRTAIGDLEVVAALSTAEFATMTRQEILGSSSFVPLAEVSLPLERVVIDPLQEGKIASGQTVITRTDASGIARNDLVCLSSLRGELLAIAEVVDVLGTGGGPIALKPKVVLNRSQQGRR